MTFQEILSSLINFWSSQGCVHILPYDSETGAATFNPATALETLKDTPFRSVYVEQCRRPQDGRFGLNPNRLQSFHQLQVIIKPIPLNIQELYLQSLEAVGLKREMHDIRFVHDDWESPTLGASGLGWEVWIDGMEVTQFTYFQIVAGIELSVPCVEVTYGLERLAMFIQNTHSIMDIAYSQDISYKDLYLEKERQWSHYNFSHASKDYWETQFNLSEKEVPLLCKEKLPYPAFDFAIKASHAFNMLESRGFLSVTQRVDYIKRVRHLSKQASSCYMENEDVIKKKKRDQAKPPISKVPFETRKENTLLLEINSEQLPAIYVENAINSFVSYLVKLFDKYNICHGSLKKYATHRRLSVVIENFPHQVASQKKTKSGPSIDKMYDSHGKITPVGVGFFSACDMQPPSIDDVLQNAIPGITYNEKQKRVSVETQVHYFSTLEIISHYFEHCVENISFPKKMTWDEAGLSYARPLKSIVALYGENIIPLSVGNLYSDRYSLTHEQSSSSSLLIPTASSYETTLKSSGLMVDALERQKTIVIKVSEIESSLDAQGMLTPQLLNELVYLSEYPFVALGMFPEKFLSLPEKLTATTMIAHQRYIPLVSKSSSTLLPSFIMVCDRLPTKSILRNNVNVLTARLSDGLFLFNEDMNQEESYFLEKLQNIEYHHKLGSLFEKQERTSATLRALLQETSINAPYALEAAQRCKIDIATETVSEFPELQGYIAKVYTQQFLDPEVAQCIEEHWWPLSENSSLPTTKDAALLSISDKIDTLYSYVLIDITPSSSSDPFALRKAAIGCVKTAIHHELPISIDTLVTVGNHPHITISQKQKDALSEFLQKRLENFLTTRFPKKAVSLSHIDTALPLHDIYKRVSALAKIFDTPSFESILAMHKRSNGILSKNPCSKSIATKASCKFEEEKILFDAILSAKKTISKLQNTFQYEEMFKELLTLEKPLHLLFTTHQIESEDEETTHLRKFLISECSTLIESVCKL